MRIASLAVLLTLALAPWPAGETRSAVVALDLEGLTRAAPDVVLGRILADEVRWSVDGRGELIVTDHRVVVDEVLKGSLTRGATFLLQTEGGAIGEMRMLASEEPVVRTGETVMLFVTPHPEAEGRYKTWGGFQGKYTLLDDRVREARDLDRRGLRAAVLGHVARQRAEKESGR